MSRGISNAEEELVFYVAFPTFFGKRAARDGQWGQITDACKAEREWPSTEADTTQRAGVPIAQWKAEATTTAYLGQGSPPAGKTF